MAKTKIFRVTNNRIHFKCENCTAKRNMTVQRGLRRRTIKCHRCGEITKCILNRRYHPRENQAGKAEIVTRDGRTIDIDLHDISQRGIGFNLPFGVSRVLSVKQEVSFRCNWDARLIGKGRFIIKNIQGQRVGAEKAEHMMG